MNNIVLYFIILVYQSSILLAWKFNIPSEYPSLSLCLGNAIQSMDISRTLLTFDNNDYVDIGKVFEVSTHISYVLCSSNNTYELSAHEIYDNYVFIVKKQETLHNLLNKYRRGKWAINAKLVVVYLGSLDKVDMFRMAWSYYIVNVIVIMPDLNLYHYLPITDGNCGRDMVISSFGNCDINMLNSYKFIKITNYHGCPVRVSTVAEAKPPNVINFHALEHPGYEIKMVRAMAKLCNFTIKFIRSDGGSGHNTTTDVNVLLYKNLTDLYIAGQSLKYIKDFHCTKWYSYSKYILYLKAPSVIVGEGLYMNGRIYSILISSFISFILPFIEMSVLVLFEKIRHEGYVHGFSDAFIVVHGLALAVYKLPKHCLLRFNVILYVLFYFIILSGMQSQMTFLLTIPSYEPMPEHLDDLYGTNLTILCRNYTKTLFYTEENKDQFNWVNCKHYLDCLKRVSSNENTGFFIDQHMADYYISRLFRDDKGRPQIASLRADNEAVYSPNQWVFYKGFPLYYRINDLLTLMVEGGLVKKWRQEEIIDVRYDTKFIRPVRFYQLQSTMRWLIGFNVAAFFIFLIEIAYSKCCRRKSTMITR